MFLGNKSQKFSSFPLSSYTRAKSWKYVFISTSNGYNSKKKELYFTYIYLHMYMFCRDSKLLVMEKMRRQFCIGPYGRFALRLLLRSAATDNIRIYTVNSI